MATSSVKILDILIEEMGAQAIVQRVIHTAPKTDFTSGLQTYLAPAPAPAPASAPAPVPTVPDAPKKKVIVKKVKPTDAAKNLSDDFDKVVSLVNTIVPPPAPKKIVVKKGTAKPIENIITNAVTSPPVPPPVIIRKGPKVIVKKAVMAREDPVLTTEFAKVAPTDEVSPMNELTDSFANMTISTPPNYRCDARVYGDKVDIQGTSLHCYKPAQCNRKGSVGCYIHEVTGKVRRMTSPQTDDEGSVYLCKACVKRFEKHDADWHGIFDDDGAPETSHFEGGAWHTSMIPKPI